MNKKGFTLIELLASLIIVSLILTITITAIAKVVKSSKNDLSNVQIELIKKGAEDYIASNMSNVPVITSGEKIYYITLSELVDSGIIDNVKNSKGEKYTNNNLIIKVVITHSEKYKKNNSSVFVITDEDEIKNIKNNYTKLISRDIYCKSVNNDTKTTGNVPTGSYIPGDEYICEVETGKQYHFFVLSTEDDNVNLIMNRNITTGGYASLESHNTDWYTSTQTYTPYSYNTYGPKAAFNSLHFYTKNWNIPNITINYTDENMTSSLTEGDHSLGYDKITTIGDTTSIYANDGTVTETYTNLKARLPKVSELINNGCSTTSSCPLWLADYLNSSSTLGGTSLSEIYGYWTLSSSATKYYGQESAWEVNGKLTHYKTYDYDDSIDCYYYKIGIRPVISISKSNLE